jgi:hypothetical protein
MPKNIVEAIRNGQWDFEPQPAPEIFQPTNALPGTTEKLDIIRERVRQGLPLWNENDRRTYDDSEKD